MNRKRIEFNKAVCVEQLIDALTRGQLAPLVLPGDRRFASRRLCLCLLVLEQIELALMFHGMQRFRKSSSGPPLRAGVQSASAAKLFAWQSFSYCNSRTIPTARHGVSSWPKPA